MGTACASQPPVELSLGVDLSGGQNWLAASVEWHPWGETGKDAWVHTQGTVGASGMMIIIFLEGYHVFAALEGATLMNDVPVVDAVDAVFFKPSLPCNNGPCRALVMGWTPVLLIGGY